MISMVMVPATTVAKVTPSTTTTALSRNRRSRAHLEPFAVGWRARCQFERGGHARPSSPLRCRAEIAALR